MARIMQRLSRSRVLGSRLAVAITSVIVTTVVVAGGIAAATVPNDSVTSAKIVNGTIQSIDIKDGTIQGVDIANQTVDAADLALTMRPLWARVGADAEGNPVLVAGRGVTSVEKRVVGDEQNIPYYLVTFNRSVAACGWTATINNSNWFGPPAGWGVIYAENDGGPDTTGPDDVLRVRLFDMDGVPIGLGDENTTFTVSAVC